jgi:endothelin-converting enzyme
LYKRWNSFLSGREYDQNGNLHQWWNNETIAKFKERTECVVDQYSNYEMNNKHLNGKQTLGMSKFMNTTF